MTPGEEDFLAEWIIEQDSQGFPPTHIRAREMAERILKIHGDATPLGNKWISQFKQRHPEISACIGWKIDTRRIHGTQPELIKEFYNLYERLRTTHGIVEENIWNIDEHGMGLGLLSNSQVLAKAERRHTFLQASDPKEWVTIIEAINSTGCKIQPLVIFKGKHLQTSWFNYQNLPNWEFTTSENGWTSNDIGLEWLKRCFLPETVPNNGVWRLLILDGHASHVSVDFMYECKMKMVLLLFLPAHSSHVLQPLDLGTFASLKAHYRHELLEISYLDDAAPIKKQRFIQAYQRIRERAMSPTILKSGWKATGLVPYDRSKGMNSNQLRIQSNKCPKPPTTPKKSPSKEQDWLLRTPSSDQQLIQSIKKLISPNKQDRNVRGVISKAGKAFQNLITQQAVDQTIISKQESQLQSFRIQKNKKRIIPDPNS